MLQDDWRNLTDHLARLDLSGRTVALFGLGDQGAFPDQFADAVGVLYELLKNSGARFVGAWPTDGYRFERSRAAVDGKFVGLVLDEDRQPTLTDQRLRAWCEKLKAEW